VSSSRCVAVIHVLDASLRKYAPTDSDTSQSLRDARYIPTQHYATSPEPIDADLPETENENAEAQTNGPSGAQHERWRAPSPGEAADPLDELISGVKEGTVLETDQDLVEEADLIERGWGGGDKLAQMFGEKEDVSLAFLWIPVAD
jgi:hypothetical protein